MADRSALSLVIVCSLVILLTFRDLMLIKQTSANQSQEVDPNVGHSPVTLGSSEEASGLSDSAQRPATASAAGSDAPVADEETDDDNDDDFIRGGADTGDNNDAADDDLDYKRGRSAVGDNKRKTATVGGGHHRDDHSDDVDETASDDAVKTIPSLKMKGNVQTLKFRFCYSCGYRNMFEQYTQLIHSRFPDLKIVGENYPPATVKLYATQFLSTFKIVLIACILFGQNPFTYVNIPTPNVFNWAMQNKLYSSMMIFFISNAIETQLITTGAFEIYLNDLQIWSKLQSERMPHEKELMQILDMNFNFESEKKAAFGTATPNFN